VTHDPQPIIQDRLGCSFQLLTLYHRIPVLARDDLMSPGLLQVAATVILRNHIAGDMLEIRNSCCHSEERFVRRRISRAKVETLRGVQPRSGSRSLAS
jgi:hypothetical protein